jgi:hypothetical protein
MLLIQVREFRRNTQTIASCNRSGFENSEMINQRDKSKFSSTKIGRRT